ncbi:ABC transporter substrate-binding protein [Mycobacterium sp. C31M]
MLLLSACSGGGGAGTPNAEGPTGDPVQGGELICGEITEPPWNLARATQYTASAFWAALGDRLIEFDVEKDEYVPYLAEEFSANEDNTEFKFKIRKGVTFSDGTALTPEVVQKNFDYRGFGDDALGIVPDPNFIQKYQSATVDGDWVTVKLESGNRYFLDALVVPTSTILAESYLGLSLKDQSDPAKIVASGAFLFESLTPGQEVVLTRREDYAWPASNDPNKGAAYLDSIRFKIVPELGLRAQALESGQVDIAARIQPSDEARLQRAGFIIRPNRPLNVANDAYAFRVNNPAVEDVRVRRALTIGFDRDALNKYALSPSFPAGWGLGNPIRNERPYVELKEELAFDPEEAKRLLDEAGWVPGEDGIRYKNGRPLELDLLTDIQGTATILAGNYLTQEWRKNLGVKIVHHAGNETYRLAHADDPTVPALQSGRGDPTYTGFSRFYGGWGSKPAATQQDYPELNALIEKDWTLTDSAEIQANFEKIARFIAVEEVLSIPAFLAVQISAVSPKVHIDYYGYTSPNLHSAWVRR